MGRHHGLRDTVAGWIRTCGVKPHVEQEMPRWSTQEQAAIMDVVYSDKRGKEIAIDVAVVEGAEGGERTPAAFALQRRERAKHRRYPGVDMHPFVVDCRGRWGKEATAWVALFFKDFGKEEKGKLVRDLRARVSYSVMQGVAEQIISSAKGEATPPGAVGG